MTVADRVDSILQKRGLSRRQLAIKAGIPPSSLQSAMERGHNITLDMLQKIASALDVPLSQLLSQNEQVGAAYLEYFSPDTNEGRSRQLHRSFDLLNEENQTKVIDYSDSLLKAEMYEAQKDGNPPK